MPSGRTTSIASTLSTPPSKKPRAVSTEAVAEITAAFHSGDRERLLNTLLDQDRFPFDDSYVGFLREDRAAIRRNPETVARLCRTLRTMGLKKILKGVRAPIVANRRRGQQFKEWAKSQFRYAALKMFERSDRGIVFLQGSDQYLRDYANAKFHAGLRKQPDFVAKVGWTYVVGEAKFLSAEGGEQRGGFQDAVTVAAHPAGGAVKVSVLDGIVWLQSRSGFYQFIKNSSLPVFSALLLKDVLQSLESRRKG